MPKYSWHTGARLVRLDLGHTHWTHGVEPDLSALSAGLQELARSICPEVGFGCCRIHSSDREQQLTIDLGGYFNEHGCWWPVYATGGKVRRLLGK